MFGKPRDGKGRATSEHKEGYDERLEYIRSAAAGMIARHGYDRTTMRAVSGATGISLSGLYHYFDSKEKLLFLIQFRTFSALLNNLREKLHGVTDPEEQLRVMIRAHVGYFVANMDALKVCSHELDSLSGDAYEETRRIRREYYRRTRSIIERLLEKYGASDGGGAALNPHVATMSLFGTLNWLYRWYDPDRGPSTGAMAGQIATQFLHGICHASRSAHEAHTTGKG